MIWLSGWTYRKSVTVSRPTGAVTDYQMKLLVGESPGSKVSMSITNPTFDSNATGWTAYNCSLASAAGGISGNCLQMTRTSGTAQQAYQAFTPLTIGKRYTLSAWVKSGTSGNETFTVAVHDGGWAWSEGVAGTTSATWTYYEKTFTMKYSATPRISCLKYSGTAGTMLFDELKVTPAVDVDCNGVCLSTFNDLRFTNSNGALLDYWIESITGTTPNQIATVWVEVDSIGTSDTTIYMYYGKSDAASYSNVANTFIFGDDFERGNDGDTLTGWTTIIGTVTISTAAKYSGTRSARVTAATPQSYARQDVNMDENVSVIYRAMANQALNMGMWIANGAVTKTAAPYMNSSNNYHYSYDTETRNVFTPCSSGVWYEIEVNNFNAATWTFDYYIDGTLRKTGTVSASSGAEDYICIQTNVTPPGNVAYFDNVLVRNFRPVEPAWGTWGSEEIVGWLSGYKYRKTITFSRAAGAVTNYQMKLLIGESSGATGESVDCGGHCLSNFNDIRFTISDGITLLDYWIESVSGTTPDQLATIWIECPTIRVATTRFYMYYGKADAAAVSSGANTFLLFDDFDDGTVSTALWNTAGTPTESGSTLTLNSQLEYIYSKTTWTQNVALRSKAQLSSGTSGLYVGLIGFRPGTGTPAIEILSNYHATGYDTPINYTSGEAWGSEMGAANVQRIYDIAWLSDRGKYAYDGGAYQDITTQVPASALPAIIGMWSTSGQTTADWLLVRQYVATEPASGTWGNEEEYVVTDFSSVAKSSNWNAFLDVMVSDGGELKPAEEAYIVVNGVWQQWWPPPNM